MLKMFNASIIEARFKCVKSMPEEMFELVTTTVTSMKIIA